MDFELTEEQKMIQSLARDFVNERLKPLERDILGRSADLSDAHVSLPPEKEAELIKMAKDIGLWGIGVPVELGGAGLDSFTVCLVEEELAQTVVPFHFGDITPLLFDCSEGQREKFLKPALDYEKKPYLALMESDGSTDPSSMKMTAEKEKDRYVLNGRKLSLSRASDDYFAVVFARTEDGITCFLVDKDTEGFSVSGGEENTGWLTRVREPMSLLFEKCWVPVENVLGKEGMAFQLGSKWLPQRRLVRGARCVGVARRLLDEASVQAQSLVTFGKPIFERINIQAALADIAMNINAARLMVYEAAWDSDIGKTLRNKAAMVKLYTTEMVQTVADRVAHIFNGPAYTEGLPMARLCRRALESAAVELTLEKQRRIIAGDILKGLKF
ncbi:MAG: acyl-CoA dehydrogenase family protein [Dehalococcoidales bacterium]|nr:acyl-CoA dehydrogenase family protein [Dehalococcoidales bacterium]